MTKVMILGWIAVLFLGWLLLNQPRTPREICSAQFPSQGIAFEVCVHKLSI